MIKVYLANLGKYNEGELVGEWLQLPYTDEELQQVMIDIGVAHMEDDKFIPYVIEKDEKGYEYVYEEYAIHDYEIEEDLDIEISEYASLNKLNELAEKLEDLSEGDLEILKAQMEVGHTTEGDLYEEDLQSIVDDSIVIYLDKNTFMCDEKNLAYSYIDQIYGDISELSRETLERYFDYEAFGRDLMMDFSVSNSTSIALCNN